MGSSNTRYVVNFGTQNLSSLIRARSVIRGIETQSYTSFNSAARSLSNLEKTSIRSSNQITRSFDAINRAMRKIGMGGGRGSMMSFGGFGLASIGIGGLIGSVNLLHRAFIQTNTSMQSSRIMIEELLGSANTATPFINKMKDLSASFGQDLNETMTASRGLMQVMKQVNTPQPVHLEKMLKMVMAVNAMDLENRGLGYTSFSFKEAFQGMGRGDFRSLRNRLEINLGKPMETAITKAIQKGDLDKAINLFDEGLKKIGINADRLLRRLSAEGFLQNINRMSSYILRTFQAMGEPLFTALTKPFAKFNSYLAVAFAEGGGAIPYLTKLGDGIRDSFKPAIEAVDNFGQEVMTNIKANPNDNIITKFVDASRGSLRALFSMLGIVKSFMMGIFGLKSKDSNLKQLSDLFSNIANFGDQASVTMDGLSDKANELGLSFGNMAKEGIKSIGNLADYIKNSPIAGLLLYQAPKTAMDATSSTMGTMNEYGGMLGGIGSLLLGFTALKALRNPIGTAVGGGKALGNAIGLGTTASAVGGATVASNMARSNLGRVPNANIVIPPSSTLTMEQEAFKLREYTRIRSAEQAKMPLGANSTLANVDKQALNKTADAKFNEASKTGSWNWSMGMISNIVNGGFMAMMAKDLFFGIKSSFSTHLPTITSSLGKFGTSIAPIASKLTLLVNPFTIAIGALIGASYKINSEAKKTINAYDQEDNAWGMADSSKIKLNNYKKTRLLTEGYAGGVGIGELNRQMKVGLHGLPVNKDNYEWFLKYGTDEKGKRAFKGVHSAFEAGLISPTDLKQMSPQMYDIFANKSQEMVHKGEIILNSKNIFTKEVEQQFADAIIKKLKDQKEKNKPQTTVDAGLTMISNMKGSLFGD